MGELIRDLLTWGRESLGRRSKRARARVRGWTPRRRLIVFVFVPVLLVCCCGVPVGVPLWWVVSQTVKAGKGEASPAAAATVYLMDLGYGRDSDNELPLFDDDRQAELVQQWNALRATMAAAAMGAPSAFDSGTLDVGPIEGGRATVTTSVVATWWSKTGGGGSLRSHALPWTFETRDDDGWRISRVTAPPWCGAGAAGYVTTCDQPELAGSGPSVTPSPSDDLLQNPREMLPCGPRDPFPELHSCPPS
jgi:hypothetical protein